jgi:hypothetical protein
MQEDDFKLSELSGRPKRLIGFIRASGSKKLPCVDALEADTRGGRTAGSASAPRPAAGPDPPRSWWSDGLP